MTVEHTTRILGRDQAYFRRAKACFVQSREVFPHKFRRIGYARSEIVGARDYLLKSYCAHRRDDVARLSAPGRYLRPADFDECAELGRARELGKWRAGPTIERGIDDKVL